MQQMMSIGRQGTSLKTRLSLLLLLGCAKYTSGYFWQPLKCYTATWQGKGQVCIGNYSGRTCARSAAEIEEYAGKLEITLNTGGMEQCFEDFRDRLPNCTNDEKQLTTPSILNNYCCGRGGSCASDTDCARAESRSGYLPESSTVLELGGSLRDFISVKKSETLGLNRTSFSFAFWARRRTISKRMMVLWHNRPHSNLHIGFHENNAFVFSFTNTAWECPEGDGPGSAGANACKGLQTRSTYPDDLNVWVHWAGTYDMPTGTRTIYRNGVPIATDTAELGLGYSGGDADLHISSGSLTDPSWTNGPFHGSLDDLFVFRRVITGTELAVLVRDRTVAYKDSLVLYLNFEEPTPVLCANPRWCASGQDVTDLSGRNNSGLLHGNWNRSRPRIHEDVVPIDFTCSAPDNAFHNCNSRKALLHDWIKGVCVNTIGEDVSKRVLANLSLPANLQANFTYPLADGDPALLHLMAECSRVCRANVALASTGCELIVAATSLAAYSFTCCGHDTASTPTGSFRTGSQQFCWTTSSILTGGTGGLSSVNDLAVSRGITLPPRGGSNRDGPFSGPGGWTEGFVRLAPSCFPRYYDDRSYWCLFKSVCGADYDTVQRAP